jgi:hypothetical protein
MVPGTRRHIILLKQFNLIAVPVIVIVNIFFLAYIFSILFGGVVGSANYGIRMFDTMSVFNWNKVGINTQVPSAEVPSLFFLDGEFDCSALTACISFPAQLEVSHNSATSAMRMSSRATLVTHTDAIQRIEFGSYSADTGAYRPGATIRAYTSSVAMNGSSGAAIDLTAPTVRTLGDLTVTGACVNVKWMPRECSSRSGRHGCGWSDTGGGRTRPVWQRHLCR